ncbi:hypothetical protein [Cognatishimia sp. MH4019]|uniref:hypothetical protein n=1 Tax=Cognatishimia sp. MH4019 TaxID=2854030 RepID=UPI001CD53333|nr:hypothetical protein [Cognatishimia sp. MH4019]
MRNISLRFPYLIYLSIASILLGVLIAPAFRELPDLQTPAFEMTEDMREHELMHGSIDVPADTAPQLGITVEKDAMDGWNLRIEATDFTFTPDTVNSENVANTGHAHLYLNEVKIARLYGPHFHIPDLPEGEYEVTVNLSSNDHSYYLVNGERIAASTTITQEAEGGS